MLVIVAALSLNASPNVDLTMPPVSALSLTANDPVDEMDQWLDKLLKLLDWLCEVLDSSYCTDEAELLADPHMLAFIDGYENSGIPAGLSEDDQFRAKELIADIYDHVTIDPKAGSPSVLSAMQEALIHAYSDLGGDPSDL